MNPLNDDDFDSNDDQIEALKDLCCELADVLSECRTLLSDEGRVRSGATLWLTQVQATIMRLDAVLSPMVEE